ncbi:MAG: YlqD family protein [Cyanobacteria bacterium P01_G01_bin.54]
MSTPLTVKRPIILKVIVTSRWKEEVTTQLNTQSGQLEKQIQDVELQGQRAVSEIQKQGVALTNPQALQQIESIQNQVNQRKNELQQKRNQLLQQLEQIDKLQMDQEVAQGQLEGICNVAVGDNLVKKLQVEVVVRDGVVEEIRGEL